MSPPARANFHTVSADEHKQALPPGFALGTYRIERVLGVGGFGVTYLCEHSGLGVLVAVKEYLPNEVAVRDGTEVHPKSAGDREGFEWGLERFLEEARTVARFRHPNVVRVRDCFEANRTAYIVMDYEDGEPLDALLRRHGTLTESQLRRVVLPLAHGLLQVHAAGFLHRDVKPANVFVRRSDESPVLLDFGSARQALGRRSRSVTAIASAGYSPPEQYESAGEQGPWTDIYALSALCYRAITGNAPVEAPRRQGEMLRSRTDPLPKLTEVEYDGFAPSLLDAISWGLNLVEMKRPRSLDEWLSRIGEVSASDRGQHCKGHHSLRVLQPQRGSRSITSRLLSAMRTAMASLRSGTRSIFGTRQATDLELHSGNFRQAAASAGPARGGRLLGPTEYLRLFLNCLVTFLSYPVPEGWGLGRRFWLMGVAGGTILAVVASILDGSFPAAFVLAWPIASSSLSIAYMIGGGDVGTSYYKVDIITYGAILFLWSLATKVGVWRASNAYNGPIGWARLAKLHVLADAVLVAVGLGINFG